MPIIPTSEYKHPFHLFNGHMETIIPSLFRKVKDVDYVRETIDTPDGDFLDIDWLTYPQADKLIILSHGLEGNSERHYIKGMARYFQLHGWDAIAWNCRSCSGRINKMPRLYHHAATDDLDVVVRHAQDLNRYNKIALIGFSMGGNLAVKYLGENAGRLAKEIKGAVVFSVPCDLQASSRQLDKRSNAFYRNRFLRKLEVKLRLKAGQFPHLINLDGYESIKTFTEFDERYTAPLHGFTGALDFYSKASSSNFIPAIQVPTLIVNAKNDPFLPASCFPYDLAAGNDHVYLEVPHRGGHGGFSLFNNSINWMEIRALQFLEQTTS